MVYDKFLTNNLPENFYLRESYDIYYTRANGHKDMVTLNAHGRYDARLRFFMWNRHENKDTTINVILNHRRIDACGN